MVKQKSNNVVNVNRLLHEEARRHKYNVSAGAVREYSGRVVAMIEVNMPDLVALAKSHHRKTIMEDDIVVFFGLKKNGVV